MNENYGSSNLKKFDCSPSHTPKGENLQKFLILIGNKEKNILEENHFNVIDETSCSLHPKSELKFAEWIVLQFQEYNTPYTVLTFSPYFLNAMEIYGEKHKMLDKMDWYLQIGDNEVEKLHCGSDYLYKPLVEPLQTFEDEKCNLRDMEEENESNKY